MVKAAVISTLADETGRAVAAEGIWQYERGLSAILLLGYCLIKVSWLSSRMVIVMAVTLNSQCCSWWSLRDFLFSFTTQKRKLSLTSSYSTILPTRNHLLLPSILQLLWCNWVDLFSRSTTSPGRKRLKDSAIEIDKGEEIHDEVDEEYYYTYTEEGDDSSEEDNEDE